MKSHTSKAGPGRWSELLLGGAVGLGAPVMVRGLSRALGLPSRGPGAGGWTAGLLGALVAGTLARRRTAAEPFPREVTPPRNAVVEPRRGHNGRERYWDEAGQRVPA